MSAPSASQAQPESAFPLEQPGELCVDLAAYDAANAAFERDLPELKKLKSYKRRWVLYHRDKRISLARSKTELRQLADKLGLPDAEIVVRFITDVPWPTDLEEIPDV